MPLIDLEELCSVKKSHFYEIFDDFFIFRKIDKKDILSRLDNSKIYSNNEIFKIEIKNGLNYSDFLDNLLKKLNAYYYDGDKDNTKTDVHFKKATEWLNQYTPKTGMLLDDFKISNIEGNLGSQFIENDKITTLNKNDKDKIINFLKMQQLVNISTLKDNEKYILLTKNNTIAIRSSKEILGYLHGDIGEFILFFLVEGLLNSPILFSKVQHSKSSGADKIKGSDGVHISYKDNIPVFNFLESKLRSNFGLCLSDAIDSQKEFLENKGEGDLNNEIHILYANKANVDYKNYYMEIFKSGFENYIDPYYTGSIGNQGKLPFNLVTGIIYESPDYVNLLNGKKGIVDYANEVTLSNIRNTLEKYKEIEDLLAGRKVTIFLLPLINNEDLIRGFLEKIKI